MTPILHLLKFETFFFQTWSHVCKSRHRLFNVTSQVKSPRDDKVEQRQREG